MLELFEVPLESTAAPVAGQAADLALEFLVQPMQFVEPVWDGLAIPSHGKLERIVNEVILLVRVLLLSLLSFGQLSLMLLEGHGGPLLDLVLSGLHHLSQAVQQGAHLRLQLSRRPSCRGLLGRRPLRPRRLGDDALGEVLAVELVAGSVPQQHEPLGALPEGAARLEALRLQRLLQPLRPNSLQLLHAVESVHIQLPGSRLGRHFSSPAVRPPRHRARLPLLGERLPRLLQLPRHIHQRLRALLESQEVIPQLSEIIPVGFGEAVVALDALEAVQGRHVLRVLHGPPELAVDEAVEGLVQVQEAAQGLLPAELHIQLAPQPSTGVLRLRDVCGRIFGMIVLHLLQPCLERRHHISIAFKGRDLLFPGAVLVFIYLKQALRL
mmetsp:Transcript_6383/g.18383  ORF Transcript_6383/g.18383 Transcript_6383/m.18383 type:complete len:382 (-) Transcript_6383:415-1560(-)